MFPLLDTARIQQALDQCPSGKAVVLERASGRLDAFLSGPLELRHGVALIVSRNTYLFASRNPRDHDVTAGASRQLQQRDGFTAWGVRIRTPERARNTDGIDPGNSTNVTITHCSISTGYDNVAIKAGKGKPTTHMTISHNHFYAGHGMSIGSETNGGASAIRVSDISINGADNGLRSKSNPTRGGLVRDVLYEDICIRDTANPIFLDSRIPAKA